MARRPAGRAMLASLALVAMIVSGAMVLLHLVTSFPGGALRSLLTVMGDAVPRVAVYVGGLACLGLLWRWGDRIASDRRRRLAWGLCAIAALSAGLWVAALWLRWAEDIGSSNQWLVGTLLLLGAVTWFVVAASAGADRLRGIPDGWWFAATGGLFLVIIFFSGHLTPALAALGVLLAATVIGLMLLQVLGLASGLSAPSAVLLGTGLGLGSLGLLTLALGTLHLLHWWLVGPLVLAIVSAGMRRLGSGWRGLVADLRARGARRRLGSHPLLGLLAVLVIIQVAINLVGSLAPEVQSDPLGGRLAVPVMYARDHAVTTMPIRLITYWPMGNEMLYTLVVLFGGPIGAKLLHWFVGMLCLAATAVIGRHLSDWRGALIAVATLASSSVVWGLMIAAQSDLTLLLYALLGFYAIIRWLGTYHRVWLLVAGLLFGFAAGVKLTGFLLLIATAVPIGLAWVIIGRGYGPRRALTDLVVTGAGAMVGSVPWLARTFLITGNPVFPFLNNLFRSPLAANEAMYFGHRFALGDQWQDVVLFPIRAVFEAHRFVETGAYSPLLLVLLPALIILPRIPVRLLVIGAYGGALTALWVLSDANLRYGLPAATLVIVLLGVFFSACLAWQRQAVLGSVACLLVVLVSLVGSVHGAAGAWWFSGQSSSAFPYRVVFGTESEVSYLSRTLTGYDSVAFLNRTYGSTARVWAPATRDYLYPAFDFMVAQDYWLGRQRGLSDVFFSQEPPEAIHRALLDLTISHLLIDMPAIQARAETARLPTSTLFSAAFLENPRWTQIEYASKGIRVYRLTTPGRPARTRSQGQNLIGDAGFEQFPATGSPWKPVGDPVPLRGEQWAATGAGAVLVDGVNHVIQALPTHEGTLYRLSLRARTEQGQGRGRFEIRWLDGNGKQLRYGWVPFAVGPDYQEQIFYETAPAGARQAVILGSGLRPTDRIVLDDVRLVVIPGG